MAETTNMDIVPPFAPVRIIRSQAGDTKTITTADQAWKMLLDDWPVDDGKHFFAALLICIDVQSGERSPEEARIAFIAAAVEAGVSLLS